MLLGADKRSAAEFSFYLAIPTMAGAFTYDLYQDYKLMTFDNTLLVAAGFAMSFVAGLDRGEVAARLRERHGFALFAWWRVIVGSLGLIALALGSFSPPSSPGLSRRSR